MGETVFFFDNDHHRKLANYDVLRYDIIKKISFMETRGAASNLRLSLGGVIAWFYLHPQFYEYHYVF